MMAYPSLNKPLRVETEASSIAVGAILTQEDTNGRVHQIQFASRTMKTAEQYYTVSEKDALAVVF